MARSAAVTILFVSATLYWIGFSMLRPMVALYFNDAGYAMAWIGLLMALHAFVPVLLAMPAGQVIDRIGTRRAIGLGSAVMLLSGLCYVWGASAGLLLPILIAQLCNGVGSLLGWGAMQAAIGQSAKGRASRQGNRLLANFAFANALAQFAGPILGGILADAGSFNWVFLTFCGCAVLCGASALFVPRMQRRTSSAEVDFQFWRSYGSGVDLLRHNRAFSIAMLFNGVLFILVDVKSTFLPIYLANLAYSNTQIGTLLSIGGVASIVIRPLVGTLMDRLGPRWILHGSLWAGCACLAALMLEPGYAGIAAIVFVWGLCTGVNQPIALILVARTVASERQGMGMSLRTMANRIIQVVNPVAIGGISALIGLTWSFGLIAASLLGFSLAMRGAMTEPERERYS
ncbi:MFS transporter [Paenibacillus sp. IB182496]|uniref:MFS transporter n=1 Tax=Paenibacillus sabuli TaxID=2772509 RepID=A0A927BNG2_9BACL|nr:MFS transporter [Paenibacillus sabuli]MBD2843761.1 MFS transporter [Paenibacillus sabuli]